jgi:hypothetical protein
VGFAFNDWVSASINRGKSAICSVAIAGEILLARIRIRASGLGARGLVEREPTMGIRKKLYLLISATLLLVMLWVAANRLCKRLEADRRQEIQFAEWSAHFHFKVKAWPPIVRTEAYFHEGGLYGLALDRPITRLLWKLIDTWAK